MDEKLKEILKQTTAIQDSLKVKAPSISDRLLQILEKAFIPLAVASIAFFGNLAATKISEGQLALAKSAADDRKSEFQRTMQGKYLEMFYREITSGDSKQQANALGLLKLLDPSLANDVAAFVATSVQISPKVKAEVQVETQRIQAAAQAPVQARSSDVLSGFVIGIYFLSIDSAASAKASQIQRHLKQKLPQNIVRLYPSNQDFMDYASPPNSLEVRYEDGIEDKQANRVVTLLKEAPLTLQAKLQTVGSTTPNFVSVFVPTSVP
jgi:uncharacterized protein YajQ (UPF0234 family)